MVPSLALRNTAGVVIPLVVGFVLGMPRGGLAMASGALNVSYSDGHDPYPQRARRMLASTAWCAIAIFLGAITGHRNIEAVFVATAWAFIAGMLVAIGTTAADVRGVDPHRAQARGAARRVGLRLAGQGL